MNDFTLPITQCQEQFSIAYIEAIASVAGYSVEGIRVDVDSIDVNITQVGTRTAYPKIEALRVQLKCTYAHPPINGVIRFPLSIKNYDDLRRDCLNPRILVVLHTPTNIGEWLEHHNQQMLLRHEAYWKSLHGMPKTTNSTSIKVNVDTKQCFTVDELKNLMNLLANGQRP